MAIGAFPLAKLGLVVIKQISKPIANGIAARARKSRIFRNYVCIPIAQFFHWYDVKVRMRVLNLGKVSTVPKLDEKKAIETGSQILSEFILVAVGMTIVIYEYNKSSKKEDAKQAQIEEEKKQINNRVKDLEFAVERQSVQLKELTRLGIAIRDDLKNSKSKNTNKSIFSKKDEKEVTNIPPISPELMNVFDKDNLKRNVNNTGSNELNDKTNCPIHDSVENVNYKQIDISKYSNHQQPNLVALDDNDAINIGSTAVDYGPITRVVFKKFKSGDLDLVEL